MAAHDAAAPPVETLPPIALDVAGAAAVRSDGSGGGAAAADSAGKAAGGAAAEGEAAAAEKRQQPATPNTPQVSSKHWRKIRSAVVALAAFRSRRVKAADFERIRMCGEGGSGLVYLVRLKNTTMFFALKVQRKTDLEAKEKRIRRALIEKEVLVACAHPFVCSLYTAFQDSRHLYLLMDFCSGGDLKSLVRDVAKRALREEEARFYVSEIVAALEWVHLHGYVYRDLKPENVLIHASGHIRLGDFGTAERGSMKSHDVPEGKLRPQEVEKALVKPPTAAAAPSADRNNETPRAAVGGTNPPLRGEGFGNGGGSGTGSGGHTFSGEDEASLDDYTTMHAGGNNSISSGVNEAAAAAAGRPNSIIVQVDPLLAAAGSSTSSMIAAVAAEAAEVKSAAAATPAAVAGAAVDDENGDVCADDGSDDGGGGGGIRSAVGCGCGGKSRGKNNSGLPTSAAHAQPFAKGRGSVKLNVLLDSQTFIGTADFMAPEMVTGKERQGTGMDWWALGVMLFEITLGTLPFHSELPTQSSNEIFRSIVNAELRFPRKHNLSHAAVDFIRQLLRKDPNERLGQRKGVGEIKRHPFFSSVHWALIANSTPPFVLSGPDTPGWLASMQPSAAVRDEKMATWTWMSTQQDAPRPATGPAASSTEAQDSLDYRDSGSGRHPAADLDKLGQELGIAAGPTGNQGMAAAGGARTGGNEGTTTTTTGEDGDEFDEIGMPDHAPVLHTAATTSAAMAAAAGKAAQRAEAAAGNGEGGAAPASGAAGRAHRKDNRASFDGYDFNTLRKVGSLRMASQKSQGSTGVPQLAAARSMGAQSSKRG